MKYDNLEAYKLIIIHAYVPWILISFILKFNLLAGGNDKDSINSIARLKTANT